ncbi:SDR family NAD(P)-dependent oxidoreductase [Xenorhabdus miraniensis]|uniref:3-ketoacyl-ACP reductase n=1 Tax=Xenorhabdus miraniensis TaxID=351674 RepID=A0A2D0JJI0_9GAMM|nr:SDR family NAD(P)-dependent oxidoreductase [Xenorhabdus miraniensis]PHM45584.1 3-ketoacyl-ACP reductase [Xenorhabdus miraniensis]
MDETKTTLIRHKICLIGLSSWGRPKWDAKCSSGGEISFSLSVGRQKLIASRYTYGGGLAVDLSKPEDVVSNLDKLPLEIDLLINNAGVYLDNPAVKNSEVNSPAMFQTTLNVNLISPFFLANHILENMLVNDKGLIVNITSGLGRLETPRYEFGNFYRTSKLALNGITIYLAQKINSESTNNVKAISYCPGLVCTDMGRRGKSVVAASKSLVATITNFGDLKNGCFYREGKELSYVSK